MKSCLTKFRFACTKTLLISCALLMTANASLVIADELKNSAKAELQAKLAKLSSFKADFSQSIADMTGQELQNSSGKLLLSTPNKLRWETQEPDEALLIADGDTVWSVDPFVEQVTIIEQSSITQNNPLMLLVSNEESQWNNVSVERLNSQFVVTTNDDNANIVSLNIKFDDGLLIQLQSTDRQQQKSLLVFSNITQNEAVDPSHFSYVAPENFIVDDQRNK